MPFIETYLCCVAGILISILLPILRKSLPSSSDAVERAEQDPFLLRFWQVARPYCIIGLFSLIAAILIVALSNEYLKDWRTALLAGYAWDSTLQKTLKGS